MRRIYFLNHYDQNKENRVEFIETKKQYLKNPESVIDMDENDAKIVNDKICFYLKKWLKNSGKKGYAIGISGGIDSAIVADLCVRAVGKENVFGMIVPSTFTTQEDKNDALFMIKKLGIKYDITNPELFDKTVENILNIAKIESTNPKNKGIIGNVHSRARMTILRAKNQELDYLLIGTTNLSEKLFGYFTIGGDGCVDVEPIAELYKTTVRELSYFNGIPDKIIKKVPTAGLWKGQTDERELGVNYDTADLILSGLVLNLTPKEIIDANTRQDINEKSIERVIYLMEKSSFKNNLLPEAKIYREELK